MVTSRGTPISAQIQIQIIETDTETEGVVVATTVLRATASANLTTGAGYALVTGNDSGIGRP